ALDLLLVINTRDANGAPIDVDVPIDELAPIASKSAVFARIVQLLDEGRTDLAAGGASFPFPLTPGFTGLDTPASFIKFNRALRARVDAYTGQYAAALTDLSQSFLNPAGSLTAGAYNVYGAGSDAPNELANPVIYAHPALWTDAELKPD